MTILRSAIISLCISQVLVSTGLAQGHGLANGDERINVRQVFAGTTAQAITQAERTGYPCQVVSTRMRGRDGRVYELRRWVLTVNGGTSNRLSATLGPGQWIPAGSGSAVADTSTAIAIHNVDRQLISAVSNIDWYERNLQRLRQLRGQGYTHTAQGPIDQLINSSNVIISDLRDLQRRLNSRKQQLANQYTYSPTGRIRGGATSGGNGQQPSGGSSPQRRGGLLGEEFDTIAR